MKYALLALLMVFNAVITLLLAVALTLHVAGVHT